MPVKKFKLKSLVFEPCKDDSDNGISYLQTLGYEMHLVSFYEGDKLLIGILRDRNTKLPLGLNYLFCNVIGIRAEDRDRIVKKYDLDEFSMRHEFRYAVFEAIGKTKK